MRCLYCGKEYWLPAQVRRDPDFCSVAHREKYNSLVERAMRCIQGAGPLPASEPMPAPAAPAAPRASAEAQEATAARPVAAAPASASSRTKISQAAPPVAAAPPAAPAHVAAAGPARADSERRLAPRPSRFRESPHIPQFAARPVFDRLQEEARSEQPEEETPGGNTFDEKEPAPAPMFGLLETSAISRRKAGLVLATTAAACVAVGGVLWIGAAAVRLGRNPGASAASEAAATPKTEPPPAAGRAQSTSFEHSLEWFRSAAIEHAAAHLSESFETGMAAWGAPSTGWAPGWSHSPDGYVRPGALALFQPTLGYADYRMEFFGEIENKSLSWVVRGKDARNYYAMKLTLARAGLRPLLSLAHYPVANGKAGHAVDVPLSIMIHNGVPYHVAVQVQGSTYRVWIEGEPVDSWSDDTLPAGGVGFFAEPGARARIYWLKVSKNDDWFGWLCARIAGAAHPDEPRPNPGKSPRGFSLGTGSIGDREHFVA